MEKQQYLLASQLRDTGVLRQALEKSFDAEAVEAVLISLDWGLEEASNEHD